MRYTVKITAAAAAAAALTLGLSACSAPSDSDTSDGDKNAPLVVGATSAPHAEILNFVKAELAKKHGLKLDVKEFDDYQLINPATENGDLDANFFQHKAYLDDFNKKQGTHIVPVVNVHIEPIGLYSKKHQKLSELKAGSLIGIPDDVSNQGRALNLLGDKGLIKLKSGVGANAKLSDVKDSKGIKFREVKAGQIAPQLPDYDAAVINGNYAIAAKLKPSKDALALEPTKNNPYANFLAVKKGNESDPRVKKLAKLLNTAEVKKFIQDKYTDGSALPAFGPVQG
ncbi:MetQ/NlpA family ABC transporter substrate-binding protein [Streptomyces sp. H27-D2]|uniref:MetQ/NlpA family ABC transporter substrate-binding protein n=1 Tax=Streptomyces sp. H27-D2 TaxID=3046304 RepID=UPI002DB6FAA0|nr:MetQ/NlpA family ABC transporter substrate-binding protein [Streptomyces sp. H27-D2]MEC4017076.1 MetQ/NlpA family ABC transporter substrate-binding protein [Streptomyces sp. H27-D2]